MNKLLLLLISVFLASCATNGVPDRINAAESIAINSGFNKKIIESKGFTFLVFERILEPNLPYAFYIEKDGYIVTPYGISDNPTPIKQMLFNLAAVDDKRNVIFIGRPCQYIDLKLDAHCANSKYWTTKRLAPDVIEAISGVIDQYTLRPFSVIGHSGGGSIATLIATVNPNVANIITIAANLDIDSFNEFHNVQGSMYESLNPINYAKSLNKIPQLHLAGGQDKTVPPFVINQYVQESDSSCVKIKIIPTAEHNQGWDKFWKEILFMPQTCAKE